MSFIDSYVKGIIKYGMNFMTEDVNKGTIHKDHDNKRYTVVRCPHCKDQILLYVDEMACRIYRHGKYKNGKDMNPHAPKHICDELVDKGMIHGCGKPYEVTKDNIAVVCEYK